MAEYQTCDRVRRRDFIKIGAVAGGLTLTHFLRNAAAIEDSAPRATSGIFINLGGGPSHLDTFDLKPEAPAEYRGTFDPIATNVPGIAISEHLPKLAAQADKFAIVRGVSHTLAAHELGSRYVNTGNRPLASIEYPGIGAVVTKESEAFSDLPPFVAIPNTPQRAGFLGVQYSPLNTTQTPKPGAPFSVRGISLGNGLTIEEVERRQGLLRDLDRTFGALHEDSQLLEGLDRFSQQAFQIITSKRAREAFDVSRESPAFAEPFGKEPFGQSCLMATRLIEAGVRFVTINFGGWDTHQQNFTRLKTRLLPALDTGLAALFNGLSDKGLLSTTAVLVTGEFGRTPKINSRAAEGGRDHYPRCMFMLAAGGRVRGGQVLGGSDETASQPAGHGYSPADVIATYYRNMGIDPTREFLTNSGRPIMIVRDGQVIDSLLA
ncbi:MAG: DUF1501 domain-containing protein [Planctomycetes bacterium]|nr:DUF1501 domain-containing protein [Planctomycetota bacterium]